MSETGRLYVAPYKYLQAYLAQSVSKCALVSPFVHAPIFHVVRCILHFARKPALLSAGFLATLTLVSVNALRVVKAYRIIKAAFR